MAKNRKFKKRDKLRRMQKHKNHLRNFRNLGKCKKRLTKEQETKKNLSFIEILTTCKLTDHEIKLLAKGLKYIPTPDSKNAKRELLRDFDELARKMRCKYHFNCGSTNFQYHPFSTKSGFVPHPASNAVENYIFCTKLELDKIRQNRRSDNLTRQERLALKTLCKSKNLVMKKCDKTSSIAIMDRDTYTQMGNKHLDDPIHYEEIIEPQIDRVKLEIDTIVNKLYDESRIDDITYKFLTISDNCRLGRMYFLPKTHKIPIEDRMKIKDNPAHVKNINIPPRPIVSLCGSVTEKAGKYIDYFLQPIVKKQWTYTEDSKSFVIKIEETKVPKDIILCTFDVTSMYTNMYHNEIVEAVDRAWHEIEKNKYDIPIPSKVEFLNLVRIVLQNNIFEFDNRKFKQLVGVGMGQTMSPTLTSLRLFELITEILEQFEHFNEIVMLSIYRDDACLIVKKTCNLQNFFRIANSIHPLLKFTFDISDEQIQFLDITVFKGQRFEHQQILDTKLYRKPTENYQYLENTSAHSMNVHKSFLIGEILRIIRACSNTNDVDSQVEFFKQKLLNRGYTEKYITPIISNALKQTRQGTLAYRKTKNKMAPPLVLATRYNPVFKKLGKCIRKHWNIINENTEVHELFPRPPIIAYKRHKNLREYLTSAKL